MNRARDNRYNACASVHASSVVEYMRECVCVWVNECACVWVNELQMRFLTSASRLYGVAEKQKSNSTYGIRYIYWFNEFYDLLMFLTICCSCWWWWWLLFMWFLSISLFWFFICSLFPMLSYEFLFVFTWLEFYTHTHTHIEMFCCC